MDDIEKKDNEVKEEKKEEPKKEKKDDEVKEEKKEEPKKEEKEEKEEPKEDKSKNKSNSKIWFIIGGILLAIVAIVGVLSLFSGEKSIFSLEPKVKVTKNETSQIQYEKYDNSLVSFDIPKGWKVVVAPFDYIHYSFKVYNPENPDYMFLFGMKLEGYNKSQAARNWQQRYYPSNLFAQLPVIDPQTTEAFYGVWNETAAYVNANDAKSEYLPKFNDFSIIETLGQNEMVGGDILRATYTDSNGKKVQGLFTASVMSAGTYYVNSDIMNLFSSKIDVWPLNVYNIIFMTTPDEDFINWQGVLDHCIGTIAFSDTFVNGFNKEESSILTTIQANQKVYDQISDMIMDSWEKRNNSYDIISQKQSDATLGYERVYDTDTGEIYKATNGFMDHYDGTKYQTITEDMYTLPTAGYIE